MRNLFVFLTFVISLNSIAQSKKEQIEDLNRTIDSLKREVSVLEKRSKTEISRLHNMISALRSDTSNNAIMIDSLAIENQRLNSVIGETKSNGFDSLLFLNYFVLSDLDNNLLKYLSEFTSLDWQETDSWYFDHWGVRTYQRTGSDFKLTYYGPGGMEYGDYILSLNDKVVFYIQRSGCCEEYTSETPQYSEGDFLNYTFYYFRDEKLVHSFGERIDEGCVWEGYKSQGRKYYEYTKKRNFINYEEASKILDDARDFISKKPTSYE